MGKKVECVGHRDGWCATKDGKPFPETVAGVETLCDHVVTFPSGSGKRVPDCPECLAVLKARKEPRGRRTR
jgi:hypothetical protein